MQELTFDTLSIRLWTIPSSFSFVALGNIWLVIPLLFRICISKFSHWLNVMCSCISVCVRPGFKRRMDERAKRCWTFSSNVKWLFSLSLLLTWSWKSWKRLDTSMFSKIKRSYLIGTVKSNSKTLLSVEHACTLRGKTSADEFFVLADKWLSMAADDLSTSCTIGDFVATDTGVSWTASSLGISTVESKMKSQDNWCFSNES